MSARRGERGAAAVETALCLCFIVLPLVFGIISYAWMLSFRQTLSQAAAEGARAAAVKPVSSGDATANQAAQQAAALAGVNEAMQTSPQPQTCNSGNFTCTVSFAACANVASGTCVTVVVSYPYRDHSLLPTIPGLGFTLPRTISYSASAAVS